MNKNPLYLTCCSVVLIGGSWKMFFVDYRPAPEKSSCLAVRTTSNQTGSPWGIKWTASDCWTRIWSRASRSDIRRATAWPRPRLNLSTKQGKSELKNFIKRFGFSYAEWTMYKLRWLHEIERKCHQHELWFPKKKTENLTACRLINHLQDTYVTYIALCPIHC